MWDLRMNSEATGPVAKTALSKGLTVQDLEINSNHGTVLSVCDNKAYFLSLSTGIAIIIDCVEAFDFKYSGS